MDMPATSRKRLASSPLNAEVREPTASIRSISPPRASRSAPTSLLVSQARPNQPQRGSLSVSFSVRDTESDLRWGLLGLACETTSLPHWNLYASQVQGLHGGMAAQEQSQHPQNRSTFLDRVGGAIVRENCGTLRYYRHRDSMILVVKILVGTLMRACALCRPPPFKKNLVCMPMYASINSI